MTTAICPPDLTARPYRLTVEHRMSAPPAALFLAWTAQFDRWFATPGTVMMRPRVNAVYFFESMFAGRRHQYYGRFLRLQSDRLVELTWVTCEDGTRGAETIVAVELTPDGDGTHLRLTHAGFPDAPLRDQHEAGWRHVLAQQDTLLNAPG